MNAGAPLILAVEDDARNVALLRAILERRAGYRLAVAGSLAGARAWLIGQHPDFVLLDVGLPDGSGLDLARELRRDDHAVPIVALSARVLTADRQAAHDAGCDGFLAKPLRTAELLRLVADHAGPPT